MPGRGDNNKKGSSGRGASNQSNQPFAGQEKVQKSNHSRQQTGGQRSEPQPSQQDQDSNRNTSTDGKDVRRS
jgi:hypothetical protein